MTIHHTRIDDAVILHGWAALSPAFEVTTVPVQDAANRSPVGTSLFARLNYDEALAVAKREGARLIAPSEVELLRQVGVQLTPYLGTPTAENGIEHSQRHDDAVWSQLQRLGWDGRTPVAGAGKHWVDGAPAGKSRLMGWDVDGAGPGLKWWQPDSVAHNRLHFDDGTTTMLVRARTIGAGEPTSLLSLIGGAAGRLWSAAREAGGHLLGPRPLRLRAVDVALAEMARGATESPIGSNAGPDVEEYLRRCVRDGRPLGIKAGNYCAAGACWAFWRALGDGEQMPFPYRASGLELTKDAQGRGAWRPVRAIREGAYALKAGDIVIHMRGPACGWERHVTLVREPMAGSYRSIEANSPVGWSSKVRPFSADDLLGAIDMG